MSYNIGFQRLGVDLEKLKYRKTTVCPQCSANRKKSKQRCLSVNLESGHYVCSHCGFSGRVDSDKWIIDKAKKEQEKKSKRAEPSYIKQDVFEQSLCGYDKNNFVTFLRSVFDNEITEKLINRFYLGTSNKFRGGSVVFWQIDRLGNVRSGKVMQYNPTTGKRVKTKRGGLTDWAHSALELEKFDLKQCLFGLPQLKREELKERPIAIVESEKTAILMTPIFPDFVWLSCGNMHGIKHQYFKDLLGKEIVLYPDVGCFDQWTEEAEKLKKKGYNITVSKFCEERHKLGALDAGDDVFDFFYKRRQNGVLCPSGYPLIWDWLKIMDRMEGNGNGVETSGNTGNDGSSGNEVPVSKIPQTSSQQQLKTKNDG